MSPPEITVDTLPPELAAEQAWDAYVASRPEAAVYHRVLFRRVVEHGTGNRTLYLRARRAGRLVGVLPLAHLHSRLFGNALYGLPYFNYCGALADDLGARDALLAAAVEHARGLGARHIELRHLGPAPGLDWPVKSTKAELFLSLPDTPAALWDAFRPKLRAQIRRPRKAGIYARVAGPERLDDFYRVFARNMRDLGTPVYGRRFFRAFFEGLGDAAKVAVCYRSGEPVAAGIVVGDRDGMEIPWASAVRDSNADAPNMLLYWTVLELAISQGFRRFDFGRSTVGQGTYQFKRQWGAEPRPLHWYYWLRDGGPLPEVNPDNPRYTLAIRAWQRLPVAVTRVVGPHLVKNLP